MELTERQSNGALVITVEGEIDLATAPKLRERLLHAVGNDEPGVTILDLGGCSFIDSSGLGVIVEVGHALEERLARLRIRNLTGQPEQLVRLTMVDRAPFVELES